MKIDRDKLIQEMVETEFEMLSDGDIMDILEYGCNGYRSFDDNGLVELFLQTHHEECLENYYIKEETNE